MVWKWLWKLWVYRIWWANSTAIQEFFETDIELCNYLYEHQLEIYRDLLEYLSGEYDELEETI